VNCVSLVKVFRQFRLKPIFLGVERVWTLVGRCRASYLYWQGPACLWWCLVVSLLGSTMLTTILESLSITITKLTTLICSSLCVFNCWMTKSVCTLSADMQKEKLRSKQKKLHVATSLVLWSHQMGKQIIMASVVLFNLKEAFQRKFQEWFGKWPSMEFWGKEYN
jgi:hypothetical protein